MKKAVFITNIPAHYRVAMLNSSLEHLAQNSIELHVIFSRKTYKRRDYWSVKENDFKFKYYYLSEKNSILLGRSKLLELGFGIKRLLNDINPDVVIISGFSLLSIYAARYSIKHIIPFIIYSGETAFNSRYLKFKKIRLVVRKYLIRRAKHIITYGQLARDYIRRFGMQSNITIAINSIDTDYFIERLKHEDFVKEKSDKVRVLYLGNVTKGKGINFLLCAAEYYKGNVEFIIVGSGNELENYKRIVREKRLSNVTFKGKVDYTDVFKHYKNADIFILPSLIEAYGLVLVEAACSGLPLIGSIYAGASCEIIDEGRNGFIVDPKNTEDLVLKLGILVSSEQNRIKFGQRSLELIHTKVNIDKSGVGFAVGIIKSLNE